MRTKAEIESRTKEEKKKQTEKLIRKIDALLDEQYATKGSVRVAVAEFRNDVINDIMAGYRKGNWLVNYDPVSCTLLFK